MLAKSLNRKCIILMNFPKEILLPKDKNFLGIVIASFSQLYAVKTEAIWVNDPEILQLKYFNNFYQFPLLNAQKLSNKELQDIHTSFLQINEHNIGILTNVFNVDPIYNLTFLFNISNIKLTNHVLEIITSKCLLCTKVLKQCINEYNEKISNSLLIPKQIQTNENNEQTDSSTSSFFSQKEKIKTNEVNDKTKNIQNDKNSITNQTLISSDKNLFDNSFFIKRLENTANYISSILFHKHYENNHSLKLPKIKSLNTEQNKEFLGKLLVSHLQSQMTTIIETDDIKIALDLFDFLMCFCFDYQQQLSDPTPHDSPLPGFYVQIMKPQKSLIWESFFEFERPWTLVTITSKRFSLIHSPSLEIQKWANAEYFNYLSMSKDERENSDKITNIKNKYKITEIKHHESSQYGNYLINSIKKEGEEFIYIKAKQIFENIFEKSLLLIELKNAIIRSTNKISDNELDKIWNIVLNDEIPSSNEQKQVLASIADFFDKDAYKYLVHGKESKVRVLLNSV